MFWKKDRPTADKIKWGRLRSMSITTRLSILFTLSGFGIFMLTSGFLYFVLISNLEKEDNAFLLEKTQRFKKALNEMPLEFIKKELSERDGFHSLIFSFRILDEKGHILFQTPGMQEAVPASIFPAPHKALTKLTKGKEYRSDAGRVYMLLAVRSEVRTPSAEKAIIQTAFDVTEDYNTIAEYARKLGVIFFLGVLFFLIMGRLIARRGLRPLRKMTDGIREITAAHLNERVSAEQWPEEIKVLADAFNRMLDRLDDAFIRLSQFSTDLAHEIRTPINNLMGEAEVALTKATIGDEYRKIIESSLEEYNRLSRLIESLLFLARTENPETSIECCLLDASDEIRKICDYYGLMAEEQGVELIYSGKGVLLADQILLQRAIGNLVANAFRHTPTGGKIEISVGQPDDQSLEIIVSDTGSGIDPKHLPFLFNRFYRGKEGSLITQRERGWDFPLLNLSCASMAALLPFRASPAKGPQ